MKKCVRCKKQEGLMEFYKKDTYLSGLFHYCGECRTICSEKKKIRLKNKYRQERKETESERLQLLAIKKTIREEKKRLRAMQKIPKIKKPRTIEEKKRHSVSQGMLNRRRKKKSSLFKLLYNLRNRNYQAFQGLAKEKSTIQLLGVDIKTAKKHIESLFYHNPLNGEVMSWTNYGKGLGKWQIDHKNPLGSAMTKEELNALCHYSNLQPLWHEDHIKKTIVDTKNISFLKKSNKTNKLRNINDRISQS